jgi:hypothetical protein
VCDGLHIYLISQEQRLAIKHTIERLQPGPTYEGCASHTGYPFAKCLAVAPKTRCGTRGWHGPLCGNTSSKYTAAVCNPHVVGNTCLLSKKRSRKDKLSSGVPYRAGCSHWLLYANEAGASWQELTLSTATEKLSGVVNDKEASEYQGTIIPRNGNAWEYRCQKYFIALPIYALLMELWIECVGHFASIIK